jgi:hypothetical protein
MTEDRKQVLIEAKELVAKHDGNISAAAREAEIPRKTMEGRHKAAILADLADELVDEAEKPEEKCKATYTDKGIEVFYQGANLQTPQEVIEHCKIDTDLYEVEKIVVNPWQVSGKLNTGQEIVEVNTPKGVKETLRWKPQKLWKADLLQIKVWLKLSQSPYTKKRQEELLELLRKKMPAFKVSGDRPTTGNLLRLHIPDLHLGKIGLRFEWDMEAIENRVMETIDRLIANALPRGIDQVCIPLGHDFFHIDREHMSRSGTMHTTSSGTPVERSMQAGDAFIRGAALAQRIVRRCIEQAKAPVHVNMVPGNHDTESVIHLGEVLRAAFDNSPDVTVNNDCYEEAENGDTMFGKSYQWGACGFYDTHGHTVKFDELPLKVAQSEKELWYQSRFIEIAVGHKHISKHKPVGYRSNDNGTMIHISPSLSPQDSWHHKFGYHGLPGAEAFLYHKEDGPIGHYERFYL